MSQKPLARNSNPIPHPYRFVFLGVLNFITLLYGGLFWLWVLRNSNPGTDAGFGAFFLLLPLLAALVVTFVLNSIAVIMWARGRDRRLTLASKIGLGLVVAGFLYLIYFNIAWAVPASV